MKKTLSLLLLAFVCINFSYAQTEKGTKNIGLNLGYHSSNQKSSGTYSNDNVTYPVKTTGDTYFVGPSFSYFIANKLELGVSAAYGFNSTKVGYYRNIDASQTQYVDYELKQNQYNGTLFLRKHIMFTNQFGLRTGPYLSYAYSKVTNETDYKTIIKDYTGGIDLGVEYFPIKKIGIVANLANVSYNHEEQNLIGSDGSKSNSWGFNLTNSLNLSVIWVFSK